MGRFIAVIAACLSLVLLSVVPIAAAEPDIQPVGNVPIPDGPAPAWIVADMDTGQVLAERDMNVAHPPASTIKTLLVVTALDELPNLDATVVGTEADTHVECSCVGIKPGRTYTARQLLDAILLMSGNDAANALADMIGGYDTAVAKMNAKAAALGALGTHAGHAVRAGRARRLRCHHSTGSGRHLPRRDRQSGVRADHRATCCDIPNRRRRQTDRQRRRNAAPISRHPRRQDRIHQRGEKDVRRGGRPWRAPIGDRHDVRADQGGRPDILGSGRRSAGLGLRPGPTDEHRFTLSATSSKVGDLQRIRDLCAPKSSDRTGYAQRPCERCWPR